MRQKDPALTTAYPSNTRPVAPRAAPAAAGGWAAPIARLHAADHAFLPLGYGPGGCLYRGLGTGTAAALAAGHFGLAAGEHPLNALERDLGVVLVSADLSDAVSVARLWQHPADACLVAFRADWFAAQASAGRAAVLGFAEPGVVFRYPLLAAPVPLRAVAALIVPAGAASDARRGAGDRVVALPSDCDSRSACEAFAARALAALDLAPAAEVHTGIRPGREAP